MSCNEILKEKYSSIVPEKENECPYDDVNSFNNFKDKGTKTPEFKNSASINSNTENRDETFETEVRVDNITAIQSLTIENGSTIRQNVSTPGTARSRPSSRSNANQRKTSFDLHSNSGRSRDSSNHSERPRRRITESPAASTGSRSSERSIGNRSTVRQNVSTSGTARSRPSSRSTANQRRTSPESHNNSGRSRERNNRSERHQHRLRRPMHRLPKRLRPAIRKLFNNQIHLLLYKMSKSFNNYSRFTIKDSITRFGSPNRKINI